MRKVIILVLVVIVKGFSQNPEIKSELPTVIPPSPTVAALMKFEEIPVNNYTGIPDISIPLFASRTHAKDINLNIALKYHAGIGANDIASDVGLGWSLFAGGSISRTIRGLPDEQLVFTSASELGKVGIYHTDIPNHDNKYYDFNENFTNSEKDTYVINSISSQDSLKVNKFLWETKELGRFDSEHDLWQFNFMGKSGRFYIKKNLQTNQLIVVPLDDYRLSIEYNYVAGGVNNANPYVPNSFVIFDELGYKYVFDVIETSKNKSATESVFPNNTTFNVSEERESVSAIHLSKVYDKNGGLILQFNYSAIDQYSDSRVTRSELRNSYFPGPYPTDLAILFQTYNCMGEFKPYASYTNHSSISKIRKLTHIDIINFGDVFFNYNFQRSDNNIVLQISNFALSQIIVKDKGNNTIKEFGLNYEYSTIYDSPSNTIKYKRLILKSLNEFSIGEELKHEFEYFDQNYDGFSVGTDYWGYFNLIKTCVKDNHQRKFPTPEFSTRDLLQKIIYPSGGCAIFDFGPNTYSYQGDVEITDYYQDDQNIQVTNNSNYTFNNSNNSLYLGFLANNYKKISFYPSIINSDVSNASRSLVLKRKENNSWVSVGVALHCESNNGCCVEFYPESNVEYKIDYVNFDINYNGDETVLVEYYSPNNGNQFLFGGGNRINKIAYFDSNIDKNFFITNASYTPAKLINFDYSLTSNPNKSSGSLVYIKPKFSTIRSFSIKTNCNPQSQLLELTFFYTSNTTQNIYSSLKSHGADVGYKDVSVYTSGLGKSNYVYSSPIDYPEQILVNEYLDHIPSKNIDYKRGNLLSEKRYNNSNKIIFESNYTYSFDDYQEQTGLKLLKSYIDINFQGPSLENYFSDLKFLYDGNYDYYEQYGTNSVIPFLKNKINYHNGNPIQQRNIEIRPVIEAYGWAKLSNKTTKEYYYPNNSSTPNIFEVNEMYTYNPINKMIEESIVSNSNGENLKTKYFYHSGNSIYSQNRIAEIEKIETYRDNVLLSTSEIEYSNNWSNNVSYLPNTIKTKKGTSIIEDRIKYNQYDEYGNPLEVQQEGGMLISYIWGYNKTQPVAKLENIAYNSIPSSHIQAIETASNANNEANLISALNALRNDTDQSLAGAMITTYTYKPLVGVSSITDPKGNTITYHYDSFGRLEFVKDKDGNILSENEYHYRTQN